VFLKRILLENVRSIASCEISFERAPGEPRRRTILLGDGGAGTSTILRSIGLLLAGRNALLHLLPTPDHWIRNGSRSCMLLAEIVSPGNEMLQIEIGIKRGDSSAKVLERNSGSLKMLDGLIGKDDAAYPLFGYGASRRLTSTDSADTTTFQRVRNLSTLFSSDATIPSFEAWALDLAARSRKGNTLVRDALDGLLPGARFHAIDRRKGVITFETADGIVPLAELGDGARGLVVWFGDLLRALVEAFPDRKDPLAASGLLLIDELELHLHPTYERLLLGTLAEKLPNFQIVAATHSPLTAHQARSGELFVLQRPDSDGPAMLHQYQGDPSRLMLHQILVSPLFGLDTGDSAEVEKLRREHRELGSQPSRAMSPSERRRAEELEEEIRDLPRWNSMLPGEEEKLALLKSIEQAVSRRDNG
jgi:hypothetical protein